MRSAARTLSALAGQERGPLPAGEGELLTRLRLGASDDYELLLSIAPDKWPECERVAHEAGVPLARIGATTAGGSRVLVAASGVETPLDVSGWDHFNDNDRG